MKQLSQHNLIYYTMYTYIGTEVLEDVNSLSNTTRWDHEVFSLFKKIFVIKYFILQSIFKF